MHKMFLILKAKYEEIYMKKTLLKICAFICLCGILASCGGNDDFSDDASATASGSDIETDDIQDGHIHEKIGTVWYTTPAIGATIEEKIDLNGYDVQFALGSTVSRKYIKWASDDISIDENNCITASECGVFTLTASFGDLNKNVYLIVRASQEDQYVIYYNDFENDDISDLRVLDDARKKVTVNNGALTISASSSDTDSARVLLPEFLSQFGDYRIVTNATVNKAADERRWFSIMHRIQNSDQPYYQLCIRQNASLADGVELACKTANNTWKYHGKASFSEALTLGKEYEFSMDVHGSYAAGFIDGNKIIETDGGLNELARGDVGLQANGCEVAFDDIKVVIDFYEQESFVFEKEFADVRNIDTKIANPAAMIYEIMSEKDICDILIDSPAVAIFKVDSSLNVLDENGNVITTVADGIGRLANKVIFAFRPVNADASVAVSEFLKENKYVDAMIVSDDEECIKASRDIYNKIRGVLDLSDKTLTAEDLPQIRSKTNMSMSRICILPSNMATQSNTYYLQSLAATVWYKAEKSDKIELYTLITSGANGIVTSDRQMLEKCMGTSVFIRNSFVRPVNIIGHRGIPSIAPENTLYGSVLAYERGANIIENDIYITTDGVIVVMHDATLDRTTDGVGSVESKTYDQLSQYMVDQMGQKHPIPTLEDYFKEFKDKNVNLFIEIKSTNRKIIPALRTLIEKYDIMDQCCVISFHTPMISLARHEIPEISAGLLTNMTDLKSIVSLTGRMDSTFNPSYAGLTEEIMLDCMYRGISIWPWTVSDTSNFAKFFKMGIWGITTDCADYVEEYVKLVQTEKEYNVKAGESTSITINCMTYSSDIIKPENVSIEVLQGGSAIKYENGAITAEKSGEYTVIFRVMYELSSSEKVNVYSQPVTIYAE